MNVRGIISVRRRELRQMLHGRRLHVRMLNERKLRVDAARKLYDRNNMRSHWSVIISARLQLTLHGRRLLTVLHHGPGQTTAYDGCVEVKKYASAKDGCKDAWKAM